MSSRHKETSRLDSVCPALRRAKGVCPCRFGTRKQAGRTTSVWHRSAQMVLVPVLSAQGNMQVGLCPSGMEAYEKRAHPCPFSKGNKQAGLRPSGMEGRKRGLVLVLSTQGNKQPGLRPFVMKARERACPRPRKQASGTPSLQNEGMQKGLSSTMEASKRDSVQLERRRAKELVLD